MKKLLALVLALVMSMSLVTISNAAFKDADKITDGYQEAVEVMNAVGVLVGDENQNFNAQENLTRAQAAKIISYLLLGNKTAEALAGSGKFTDVAKTSWFAGFVDYCASTGVVNGVGDGKFDPNGQLTGYQFAKMLLVALGYDATIEKLVGTDWQINVSKLANQVGLFAGMEIKGDAALTREQAAQMAFNTLKAPLVQYSNKGGNISINGAEINIGASNADYLTSTNKKAQTISNKEINGKAGTYTVEFAEQYYPGLVLSDEYVDDFGRPAVAWAYKNKEIGTYVQTANLVKEYNDTVKGKDIYSDIGYSSISDYDITNIWVDGKAESDADFAKDVKKIAKNNKDTFSATGKGVLLQVFVDDEKEEITFVVINTYLAVAGADYNTKGEYLLLDVKGLGSKKADLDNLEEYKKDDVVLVTAAYDYDDNAYVVKSVEDAESTKDVTITAYTTSAEKTDKTTQYVVKTITSDSKYDVAKKADWGMSYLDDYNKDTDSLKDATYNLYFDTYGNVIGIEQVEAKATYIFVVGYEQGSTVLSKATDKALIINTDGTMEEVTVRDDKATGDAASRISAALALSSHSYKNGAVNTWFKYTMDGDTVILKDVPAQIKQAATASEAKLGDKYTTVSDGTNVAYGNDKSVLITVDADYSVLSRNTASSSYTFATAGGSITGVNGVFTGIKNTELKVWSKVESDEATATDAGSTYNANGVYALYDGKSYITYAVVVGENSTNTDNTVFFTSMAKGRAYDSATKTYYVTYNVVKDGVAETIKVEDDAATTYGSVNALVGNLYKVVVDKDGYVTKLTLIADNNVTGHSGMNTVDNGERGYAIYTTNPYTMQLTLAGATLWVDSEATNNNYVRVNDDTNVFVRTIDDDADKYVEYSDVSSALKALTMDDSGDTTNIIKFVAICDDNGYATTIIIVEGEKAAQEFGVKFEGFENTFYVFDTKGTDPAKNNMVSDTVNTVKVVSGGSLSFKPVAADPENVALKSVKVGSTVLTPDASGYYTVSDVKSDIVVKLESANYVTVNLKVESALVTIGEESYTGNADLKLFDGQKVILVVKKADGMDKTEVKYGASGSESTLTGFGGEYKFTVETGKTSLSVKCSAT